jgi:hypothetical protein
VAYSYIPATIQTFDLIQSFCELTLRIFRMKNVDGVYEHMVIPRVTLNGNELCAVFLWNSR